MAKTLTYLIITFGLFLQMNLAYAWNGPGHMQIAVIAWNRLTPAVKAKVVAMLNSGNDAPTTRCTFKSMDVAATWLDCVREKGLTDEFANHFHADRTQLCPGVVIESRCTTGHCASDALNAAVATLKNINASAIDKRIALKVILHLVGDLHQPLHAATGAGPIANGGSTLVKISAGAAPMTLHEYWDIEVIKNMASNQVTFKKILATAPIADMIKGDVNDWIKGTVDEVKDEVYAQPLTNAMCDSAATKPVILLNAAYIKSSEHYAYFKLVEAGVRMAHILNSTLGSK